MAAPTCPAKTQLEALLSGNVQGPELETLTQHVEACAACQRTLENLLPANRSWVDVLAVASTQGRDVEPGLAEVLRQARTDPNATQAEKTVTDAELPFLNPSSKPGYLGRLAHYEVQEVVGKGGMGIVLKAFDEQLHRVVAIKVLAPELAASAGARKRFIREARTAAAVSHDHVIGIFEVDDKHRPPFLAMQYIAGQSLQDKLDRDGPLETREILRIAMQIASGLAAAHAQGFLHRDIKPANILLENGVERVKITDFGLARAVDDASVTQSGVIAGTPSYMSPEQAAGEQVDHRSDLFSLGSVMYAMCTGRPPFRASGVHAVMKRVIEDTPRPIQEVNTDIPDWLSAIIQKLLAKKPEDRFQTAKEVGELLEQHLAHLQQPSAVPMPPPVSVVDSLRESTASQPAGATLWWLAPLAVLCVLTGIATIVLTLVTPWQEALLGGRKIETRFGAIFSFALIALGIALWTERRRIARASWVQRGRAALSTLAPLLFFVPVFAFIAIVALFSQTPTHAVAFEMDDPAIVVRIWPTAQDEAPVNLAGSVEIMGKPAHVFQDTAKSELSLPEGQYWLTAELAGQEVHRVFMKVRADSLHLNYAEETGRWVGKGIHGLPKLVSIPGAANLLRMEKAKLQGAWRTISTEREGKPVTQHFMDRIAFRLIFQGDRVRAITGKSAVTEAMDDEAPYHLDPFKKPGTLDIERAFNGKNMLAIYRWQGANLQICASPTERPADFTTEPGSHRLLYVLKRAADAPKEVDGWAQLFNATDPSGWETHPDQPGKWQVKDGLLTCTGPQSHLYTERGDFTDVHVRAVMKINEHGDSGVIVRGKYDMWIKGTLVGQRPQGYEVNVQGKIAKGEANTGSVLWPGPLATVKENPVRPDEWFTLEVVLRGHHFRVLVDGKEVANFVDEKKRGEHGRIVLQHNGPETAVHFKKIEMKELPPTGETPKAVDSWAQLFDGTSLKGWSSQKPGTGDWVVADGAITCSGPMDHLFSARDDYADFHLRAVVKINAAGNSGIYFRAGKPLVLVGDYEAQITNHPGQPHKTGSLYGLVQVKDLLMPPDTWFTYEIIAQGDRIRLLVDGKQTADYRETRPGRRGKGHVVLQHHDAATKVHFKTIEIKELPPIEKAVAAPAKPFVILPPNKTTRFVEMQTSLGVIVFAIDRAEAPLTAANFLAYVGDGFYDGTIFHRVIPKFVIQGGGHLPGLKEKKPFAAIKLETGKLLNLRGTIGMSRTGSPDSATAQFYINLKDNPALDAGTERDGGYCVFGKVIEGMDVVDRIAAVKTQTVMIGPAMFNDVPAEDVVIQSFRVVDRAFATLGEAVAAVQPGDTIEIRSDGPFVMKPLEIKLNVPKDGPGKRGRLCIRAGEGHRPVLVLEETDKKPSQFLLKCGADLVLEGLELRRKGDVDWDFAGIAPRLVEMVNGDLFAANCRFVIDLHGTAIFAAGASRVVELRNCEYLTSGRGPAFLNWGNPASATGNVVTIDNCVVVGGYSLFRISFRSTFNDALVKITNTTAVVERSPIWFFAPAALGKEPKEVREPMRYVVTGCAFKSVDSLIQFNHIAMPEPHPLTDLEKTLLRFMSWRGENNTFDLPLGINYTHQSPGVAREQPLKRVDMTWKEWGTHWGSENKACDSKPLLFESKDVLLKASRDPASVVPQDLRLTAKSPGGRRMGKDGTFSQFLGADLTLVGPGEACERWRKTPDYDTWRERAGQP